MLHWLIESAQDLQDQPEWFLSKAELEKYFAFQYDKRRAEWLLGRWTAKRLMQAALLETDPHLVALDALEIANDADGVPFVTFNVQSSMFNLSISHSHEHALCAISPLLVGEGLGVRLGADLEFIEPRAENFVGDYFTADEAARVNASSNEQRAMLANAIWSAKEAALKALRKGLSVDTRAVEICIPKFDAAPEHWTRFEIILRRGEPSWSPDIGQAQGTAPTFHGWWRVWENFVLTLVTDSDEIPAAEPFYPETLLVTRHTAPDTTGVIHDSRYGIVPRRIAQATRHHARHRQRN